MNSDTTLSAEGYFVLSWDLSALPENATTTLLLQQANSAGFSETENLPVPQAGSMTLTGLPDGDYFYRVGLTGAWSEVLRVTVQHHSLQRAFICFLLGLSLFVVLAGVIFVGNRNAGGESA